jgi:hypothetical protein
VVARLPLTATTYALSLLSALLPRDPLSLHPILLTLSVLGEGSEVDYKIQRQALRQLAVLFEMGAVGDEGRDALDRLVGVLERGLEYRILRCALLPSFAPFV